MTTTATLKTTTVAATKVSRPKSSKQRQRRRVGKLALSVSMCAWSALWLPGCSSSPPAPPSVSYANAAPIDDAQRIELVKL